MDELKAVLGAGAADDPGRPRCTISSSVAGARSMICSSGTWSRFSSEDETIKPSSVDLIAPANLAVALCHASLSVTLRTQNNATYPNNFRASLLRVIGTVTSAAGLRCGCPEYQMAAARFGCHGRRVAARVHWCTSNGRLTMPKRCNNRVRIRLGHSSLLARYRRNAGADGGWIEPADGGGAEFVLGGLVVLWHAGTVDQRELFRPVETGFVSRCHGCGMGAPCYRLGSTGSI